MNTMRGSFRAAVLMAAAASVLALAGGAKAQDSNTNNKTWPYATKRQSPVLAVVGDISCQPDSDEPSGEAAHENCGNPKSPYTITSLWQSQEATANQIEAMKPDAVALLGDLQYQVGQYQDFEQSFDLTYGAFKYLHRPSPGNHEFYDEHSQTGVAGYGYFSYYNGYQVNSSGQPITVQLGDPCPSTMTGCGYPGATTSDPQPVPRADGQAGHFEATGGVGTSTTGGPVGVGDGWYSYNVGSWHLISLNIECETQPGGCSQASGTWLAAETDWLKNDLAADHSACTLAYWHQPTYSGADSLTEEGIAAGTWWQLLYDAGADLVLNGHDHLYARYAPIRPYFDASDTSVSGVTGTWLGTSDPNRGIREFIVGTGGETLDTLVTAPAAGSTTDWDGKFNQQFLEAGTGNYWGVMALTLGEHGYAWDYESALEAPVAPSGTAASYSDKGVGSCHGGHDGNW